MFTFYPLHILEKAKTKCRRKHFNRVCYPLRSVIRNSIKLSSLCILHERIVSRDDEINERANCMCEKVLHYNIRPTFPQEKWVHRAQLLTWKFICVGFKKSNFWSQHIGCHNFWSTTLIWMYFAITQSDI